MDFVFLFVFKVLVWRIFLEKYKEKSFPPSFLDRKISFLLAKLQLDFMVVHGGSFCDYHLL